MKINSIGNSAIQVQIDGEDYSVADIVHKELLNVKHVKFAGVAPPHPLIKTLTLQIHTDGADENGLLKDAVTNAKRRLQEILEAAQETFPDAIPPKKVLAPRSEPGLPDEPKKEEKDELGQGQAVVDESRAEASSSPPETTESQAPSTLAQSSSSS